MTALPRDYDLDPGRFLASTELPHDDVHPYVAARLGDAGARIVLDVGGGSGRLARLLPEVSMRCLLIDLSPTMLALAPRPAVRAHGSRLPVTDRWDAPLVTLSTVDHAAAFLRIHGLSDAAAHRAAVTLQLPLALTMRGCFVYATRAPRSPWPLTS